MIRTISDLHGDFWKLYQQGGMPRGESTGFVSLDPFFTIRRGELTLVTGIPRHGKSSFVDNVIVSMAERKDWKWLIFSPENWPVVRHAAQLAEIWIGRPFRPGMRQRMTPDDFVYASAFLDTQVQFLEPPAALCNVESILEIAGRMHIHGLVIDPWNRLLHSRGTMSETDYIAQSLGRLCQFARERDVHVFIVAHPAKLMRIKTTKTDGTEAETYPIPTPYDISGSAHWLNMSDNCLCVWRDLSDLGGETQIHVQKIRFRENGSIGMCKLGYDTVTGQYIDRLAPRRPFDAVRYEEELRAKIERHEEELAIMQERMQHEEAS